MKGQNAKYIVCTENSGLQKWDKDKIAQLLQRKVLDDLA